MKTALEKIIMQAPDGQLFRLQAAHTALSNGNLMLSSRLLRDTARTIKGPLSIDCIRLAKKMDNTRINQQQLAIAQVLLIFGERIHATTQTIEQALANANQQLETGETAAACLDLACKYLKKHTPGAMASLKNTVSPL